MSAVTPEGALAGIRVLDLSRFIAGPLCAQVLGDMGAEVIKVEGITGEDARRQGPTYKGESLYTMAFNRNKYGITLNTRHRSARPILDRLLAMSDVLVENYRPRTLAAMGLGSDRLRELNPRLIVTSLSGFGQQGPLADRTLFDPIAQAASGLMAMTGEPDGPPTLTGAYIADHVAGLYGAIGTVIALYAPRETGTGQAVDVASLDSIFASLGSRPLEAAMLGQNPVRTGSRDPFSSPASLFAAADGHVFIHAGTDSMFPRLCAAIGRTDLVDDERFATVSARLAAAQELEAIVSGWTSDRTREEISGVLDAAGVPCSPVASLADVVASANTWERGMLERIDHRILASVVVPGIPMKLTGTPESIRKAPPTIGEDNDYVYRQLVGLTESEIADLRAAGAI